eukprot:458074_1
MTEQKQEEKEKSSEIDKLTNKWNVMAPWYSVLANEFMAPGFTSLIQHLKLNGGEKNGFKVLDVAIGDGINTNILIKELINNKSSFEYYGIDISQKMVSLTNKTIQNDTLLSLIDKNKYKISVSMHNAEDLSIYNNNTFDRYIASLCLNLTPNAYNMIKESYRILKPNGITAFSIWGHKDKSYYFQSFGPIYDAINQELQITPASSRSNWYLGNNMKDTINIFKSVGYSIVYYFDINVAVPINNAKEWSDYYLKSPKFIGLLNQCNDEKQKKRIIEIMEHGLNRRFEEIVIKQNKAITHNNICIIAVK